MFDTFIESTILMFVAVDPISLVPILIAFLFAAIAMWLSAKLSSKLGPTVITVVQKIFGLLLGALAIEFVIDGVINSFDLNR